MKFDAKVGVAALGAMVWGLASTPAWANGNAIGPHASTAMGLSRVQVPDDGLDMAGREIRGGFGLSYDSAVSGDKRVAYRATLGLGGYNSRVYAMLAEDRLRLTGLTLSQTVPVRLAQVGDVRVWAGPHATLAMHRGNFDEQWDIHVRMTESLYGVSAGFNTRISSNVSVSAAVTGQGGFVFGSGREALDDADRFVGTGLNVGASVGLLFQPTAFGDDR